LSIEENPAIYDEARKLVHAPPMKTILLQGTELDESALGQIKTVFVSLSIRGLRGWCGPSMAVINVYGLKNTYHLEHVAPMAALIGHETKHALQRKQSGNDLNFLSPTKPDLISHVAISEANQNREAGLWFELTAIGEKFRFDKEDDRAMTIELMGEILKGLADKRVPALNDVQLRKYSSLRADHNQEAAFEYVPGRIIE
jgi:hypothetical protein